MIMIVLFNHLAGLIHQQILQILLVVGGHSGA